MRLAKTREQHEYWTKRPFPRLVQTGDWCENALQRDIVTGADNRGSVCR